jgi:PqqD family protein of HPr-rel-A system
MKWQIAPGQSLRHRHWDQEYVLYNDLSGATHLLDEPAMSLLLALRDGGVEPAELDDPELAPVLAGLAELHLLAAIPC